MPHLAEVQRNLRTDDGFGGSKGTAWTPIASNLPARVTQAQTLDLGGQGARKIEVEKWTVRLPYGADCQENDRVVWDGGTILVDEVKKGAYRTVLTVAGEKVK